MKKTQTDRPLKGILLLTSALLIFSLSWVLIKMVSDTISVFEIIFFRSSVGTIMIGGWLLFKKRPLKGGNQRLLFVRSFFGFLSLYLIFYAIGHSNIGDVATLSNTAPFFIVFLAPFITGEKFRRDIFIWLLAGFGGVIMILKPGSGFVSTASIFALISGITSAIALLCIRRLHRRDTSMTITFYFMWTTMLASIPFLAGNFVWPDLTTFILLILVGVMITIGQLLETHSYKFAPPTVLAPFHYTFVVFSFLAGLIFLSEKTDIWSIAGTLVVISSGIIISYRENSHKHQQGTFPAS